MSGRVKAGGVMVVVATVIAAIVAGGGVSSSQAHLWVDSDGGTCTRSSSAAEYASAAACGSIDAAWDAASAGDTIRVRPGTYAAQTVTGDKASTTYVIGGGGGTTVLEDLDTKGDRADFSGFTVNDAWDSGDPANSSSTVGNNVTIRNSSIKRIYLNGGGPFSLIDSTVGNFCSVDDQTIFLNGSHIRLDGFTMERVTVENVTLCDAGHHLEQVRIDGDVRNVTISQSTFCGNESNTSTLFTTNRWEGSGLPSTPDPQGLTVENSFFCDDDNAVFSSQTPQIAACIDYRFAYNTFREQPLLLQCGTRTDVTVVGNLGMKSSDTCLSGVTYSKNVWQHNVDVACGTDLWVSGTANSVSNLGLGGDGFHLTGTSVARGAGSSGDCPAEDHDGEARPQPDATTCDAGADERS